MELNITQKVKRWVKDHEGEIGATVFLTAIPALAATAIYYIGKSRGAILVQVVLSDKGVEVPIGKTKIVRS